jgi:S-DNA-T family DNA segregation ATPase FtsK/SpoIIIE
MSLEQLTNLQADYIEMTLWSQKINARVVDRLVLPRIIRYGILLGLDERPERVERLRKSIAHRLGAAVRINTGSSGDLSVEVERPDRAGVLLSRLIRRLRVPAHTAILGLDMDHGEPLLLHLPSYDVAHVLISGTTGSGKTVLARSLIASLALFNQPDDLQMILIDPKDREFADLAWLPHLMLGQITVTDDAVDVTGMLVETMLERDRIGINRPLLILVIDELADLLMTGGDPVRKNLQRLIQRGRGAGIHLVACTQKPSADAVGSIIRSNFPVRIVGSVTRPEDARLAAGIAGTGAEQLLGGGDFLLCQFSETTRFQAAYTDEDLVHQIRYRAHRLRRVAGGGQDPLQAYRETVKAGLRVVADNRPDRVELDARRVLAAPGWPDDYIQDGEFTHPNWQPAVGELIGRENAGAGHYHIVAVGQRIVELVENDREIGVQTK